MPHDPVMPAARALDPVAAGDIAIIINPAAKSTGAARQLDRVRALAAGARLIETRCAGDARRLARDLADAGCPVVVAAGGDGTMNEVAAGLLEAGGDSLPALGLLPLGTMNVFALELGLPVLSLDDCWQRLLAGRTRPVDAWRAGEHVFMQMAGIGVDATVILRTTWEAKKRWGPLSYLGTLAHVLDQPPAELRISLDDGPWLSGTTALLGNGRLYGGPFAVFPEAVNDDGLLDIMLVHGHGPATFSNLVADVLMNGIDADHEIVTRLRGRRARIEAPIALPFEIDGELGGETPVTITRHERRLRVII
jgi:diacylglycerol kinase (ATP)